ncbi:Uncharacterised protein [Nocardia otitidiscaviarum]|uniref:Uncharacterized protein n=1 Tax=Nocardia otitidiscaviarum TaxID=1823 RepID=A0A378YSV8_9NOCA|nr:Uncharacterised protein [Nocardia otitidiscaviarum]
MRALRYVAVGSEPEVREVPRKSAARVGFGISPYEAAVSAPYRGARAELIEPIDLAHEGVLDIAVERFTLDDAPEASRRPAAGTLRGRAVIVP